jgi:hypothetical protein
LSYLIDTNALSELRKRQPHLSVVRWFAQQPADVFFLSVLTLGELRKGIQAMSDGARRASFSAWLETEVPDYFSGRILDVDVRIAERWGRLCAEAGRTLPVIDSLLAATALEHGLTLVTRNLGDFELPGVHAINPWLENQP